MRSINYGREKKSIDKLVQLSNLSQLAYPSSTLVYLTATFWNELTINLKSLEIHELQQKNNNDTLSGKLKYHRALVGTSRRNLEKILNLPANIIKSIEDKNCFPDRETSKKLATYFNLSTKYFYDEIYENNIDIATCMKQYRERNKLTYKDIAKLLNLSSKTIEKWEKRATGIKRENYYKLKDLGIIP